MEERDDGVVVREEIRLMEGKLVVEHIQELPLYPAHIALAKHTCAQRPVYVLQGRVVAVLYGRKHSTVSVPYSVSDSRTGINEPCWRG